MKAKFIQKVMAGALAMTLVIAPAVRVQASDTGNTGASSSESTEEQVEEITGVSIAEIPTTSSVAGVRTTVRGVYLATVVNGSVITTPLNTIAAGYGLTAGETPYARIYNMDVKKSPLAAAALNSVAQSVGATVGPYVNVELGKMSNGKFGLLPSDGAEITVSFGIPASFAQSGKTFAVACVRPGGAVSILQDVDDNPNTVTFNTTGGQGAYAIIRY